MYNSMYAKLPDPLSRVRRLKGVACETTPLYGAVHAKHLKCKIMQLVLFITESHSTIGKSEGLVYSYCAISHNLINLINVLRIFQLVTETWSTYCYYYTVFHNVIATVLWLRIL